jgi:TolB protein
MVRTRTPLLASTCLTAVALAGPGVAVPGVAAAPGSSTASTAHAVQAAGRSNGLIAYTDSSDNRGAFDVYTVRRSGQGVRRLTHTGDAFSPRWSPSGRRIAFERNRVGNGTQLWTMGPHGGHQRLLVSGLRGGRFPSWSPDGRRIVFAADAAHGTRQLFVLDLRSHHVRRLTHPGPRRWTADEPAWSPRGGRIAFIRYRRGTLPDLYTVHPDGRGLRRLTRSTLTELDPAWSPTGSLIAYTRSRDEMPCGSDVFVVGARGGTPTKLVDRGCDDDQPAWAPDGTRLVLYSNQRPGTAGWRRHSGLWTVRADGSGLRMVVQGLFAGSPDWQPR